MLMFLECAHMLDATECYGVQEILFVDIRCTAHTLARKLHDAQEIFSFLEPEHMLDATDPHVWRGVL